MSVAAAPSSALAFAVGATNGHGFNRSWRFRAHGNPATLARYLAAMALGALFSALGATRASTDFSLRRLAAECLVPVITHFTYTLLRRLVLHDAWGASGATGSP